jgi:RNA polymerase sigma-70 factor (ECF subfamily)
MIQAKKVQHAPDQRYASVSRRSCPTLHSLPTAVPAPAASAVNQAMDRYAVGEDDAFQELYQLLSPRLYRYLLRQTRDRGRAEDLMQQTLLQIHTSRGRFLRGADVTPWAFAIARRLLIDSIRRRKRESETNDRLLSLDPLHEPGSDELLQSKRLAETLAHVLAQLPDSQRTTFEMIRQDGLSLREAAAVMGTTVNAIKLRAHRAYVALRSSIADELEAPQ